MLYPSAIPLALHTCPDGVYVFLSGNLGWPYIPCPFDMQGWGALDDAAKIDHFLTMGESGYLAHVTQTLIAHHTEEAIKHSP